MKKILAVSLVAMMAVSTARADIASTAYVQGAVGAEKALRVEEDGKLQTQINDIKAGTSIANGAIGSAQIATGAVNSDEIAANAVTTAKIADKNVTFGKLEQGVQDSLALADSAVQSVTTGTGNGTIAVDGEDVAVKGLGSAAFTESGAYATAAQGTKADNALPKSEFTAFQATNSKAISDAQAAAEGKVTELANGTVATHTQQIAALQSDKQDAAYLTSSGLETGQDNTKYYTSVKYVEDAIATANSATGLELSAINKSIGAIETSLAAGGATANAIAEARAAGTTAQQQVTDLTNGTVATHTQQISDINASLAENGATGKAIAEAKAAGTTAQSQLTAYKSEAAGLYAGKSYEATVDSINGKVAGFEAAEAVADEIAAGTLGTDGTYVLTATVANGKVSGYKWESIGRTYSAQ